MKDEDIPLGHIQCPRCKGIGQEVVARRVVRGAPIETPSPCKLCGRKGYILTPASN
jgi:DnaJ-class molecular chaperone